MPKQERDLTLYGLAPSDIASLREPNGAGSRGGMLSAHSLHAGNQLLKFAEHDLVKQYIADGLEAGAEYFNTCIVLDATTKQIETIVDTAKRLDYVGDLVTDPTYPFFVDIEVAKYLDDGCTVIWDVINDGKVLVTRNQVTFGWILGDKTDPVFKGLVGALKLAK